MNKEKKKLEAGDIIFRCAYGNVSGRAVIDRVTGHFAFAGSVKFKREYIEDSWLSQIGAGKWNTTSYYPYSVALDNKFKTARMIQKLKNVDWESGVTINQLEQVYEILFPTA